MVESIPLILNPSKPPQGIETMSERIIRKSKEQPLVPLGAAATTAALLTAFYKQRRGKASDMNKWLRARIIFQGLTVVALLGGSYALGQTPAQQRESAEKENERIIALAAREREEFEKRLQAAEDAHAAETELNAIRAQSFGTATSVKEWKADGQTNDSFTTKESQPGFLGRLWHRFTRGN